MSKEKTIKLVQYILLVVVGILFAVSIANEQIIKYCIGGAILVYGLFLLIKTVYITRSFVLTDGISGAALVALGVATLCDFLRLVEFGTNAIAVIIASIGALFILEAIVRFINHNNNLAIAELVVGLILLALGLMLSLWGDFQKFLWVIFGVLLAIYGIYCIVLLFTKPSALRKKK